MKGLTCKQSNAKTAPDGSDKSRLELLLQRLDVEVMRQDIDRNAAVWLSAAEDPTAVEFFYVLAGKIRLFDTETPRLMRSGDYFYVEALERDFRLEAGENGASLLYVTSRPMYELLDSFHTDLQQLLAKINDTDRITYKHSRSVMRHTLRLMQRLGVCEVTYDDLATAALFHDVGKCSVPEAVLKKNGPLTRDEYADMKRHSQETYRILLPYYGERVAGIAKSHHERLDGSGYPDGLCGDEIHIGARIIAVADAYDAMTSWRTYGRRKKPEEAIAELYSLPHQYDARVVRELDALNQENLLVFADD